MMLTAPVYAGWNVWTVYALDSLSFSPLMVGVSADRRLRIWVEDAVRFSGFNVADPLALKGDQVQILPGVPQGLSVSANRASLPVLTLLDGKASLKAVRFFNKGTAGQIVWPIDTDGDFMLESVLAPNSQTPLFQSPPPNQIADAVTQPVVAVGEALKPLVMFAGVGLAFWMFFSLVKK